jgi:hypothetical protein
MKILILICFLLSNSIYCQQESEIRLTAKVSKIDSTKSSFIIYINGKSGRGIFTIPRICNNRVDYKFKLEKWKSYFFRLKRKYINICQKI